MVAAALVAPALATNLLLAKPQSAGDAALFARLDTNSDGRVVAAELDHADRRLFARLLRRCDKDADGSLSRAELLEGLTPHRPEKPIEAKQPAEAPQADAIRYLLLTMDSNRNAVLEADETPDDAQRVFALLTDRLDRDNSGALEPRELSRGARALALAAARYVESREIDVQRELKKLERQQGKAAERFDGRRPPVEMLADPRQARALFDRLDANGDRYVAPDEVPEPFQPQVERFLQLADRDDDARLSEQEFLAGAARIARFLARNR